MPVAEYLRIGLDGKVVEGVTILRDPQTGQHYEVLEVISGRMPTPIDLQARPLGSAAERCAMYGGRKQWRED